MGSGWKTFISKGLKIDIQLHHREVTKIIPLCTLVTRSKFRSYAQQCPDFHDIISSICVKETNFPGKERCLPNIDLMAKVMLAITLVCW